MELALQSSQIFFSTLVSIFCQYLSTAIPARSEN